MDTAQINPPVLNKGKSFFKWILVVGLVIVINLFAYYAIDAFYKEPQFDVFCVQKQVTIIPDTQDKCVAEGGQWTEDPNNPREAVKGVVTPGQTFPVKTIISTGYCNINYACQKDYDSARKIYNRNVFLVMVILGVALVIGSYSASVYGAVSLGFALAGILSLVIGSMRYWSDMDERLRVIVLGVALVALIWYGIKKFRE